VIIGSQTFGKGTVQTLIPLRRGQLKITAAKFYRISGQSTQHQGVLPDIEFPEIYDAERIGESSLDDAMPWDVIEPASYRRSNQIRPYLEELKQQHALRATNDPDFRYFRALALKSKENNRKTHLSLNLERREREKNAEDRWRLNLENTLRTAKGRDALESLEALDEERQLAHKNAKDPGNDAMLRETGNILIDYIGLTRQIAFAEIHDLPAQTDTTIQ